MNSEIARLAAVGGLAPTMRRAPTENMPYTPERNAAYRRLAVAILGLDVSTVASQLQSSDRRQMSAA